MVQIQGQSRWLRVDTAAETTPGVANGSQTIRNAELASGGFGLNANAVYDDAQIEGNRSAQPSFDKAGFNPQGSIEMVASPYVLASTGNFMNFMLTAATTRTAGALSSYTMYEVNPLSGINHARQFTGNKFNGLSFSWDEGNRLKNPVADIMGQYSERVSHSTVNGWGTPTFPSYRNWNFTFMGLQLGAASATVTTIDKTLRNFTLDLTNGCTHGKMGYVYDSSGSRRNGPTEVVEGEYGITGSFEVKMQNADWLDRYLNDTSCQIRLMGFHPDSPATRLKQASMITDPDESDGVITATVWDSSNITAGDYVYIEDSTAANPNNWVREVLYASAATDDSSGGTDTIGLEIDGATKTESVGRNQTFTGDAATLADSNTRIYKLGMQLLIRSFDVTNREPVGGALDTIYERITYRAAVSGSNSLLGWMVR